MTKDGIMEPKDFMVGTVFMSINDPDKSMAIVTEITSEYKIQYKPIKDSEFFGKTRQGQSGWYTNLLDSRLCFSRLTIVKQLIKTGVVEWQTQKT